MTAAAVRQGSRPKDSRHGDLDVPDWHGLAYPYIRLAAEVLVALVILVGGGFLLQVPGHPESLDTAYAAVVSLMAGYWFRWRGTQPD